MAQSRSPDAQLPPFAVFPPASFRKELVPEEWEACLDAWITLAEIHLRLSDERFVIRFENAQTGLVDFLVSYIEQCSSSPNDPTLSIGSKATSLRRLGFSLIHRSLSSKQVPDALMAWTFLAQLAKVYARTTALRNLLVTLWKLHGKEIEQNLHSVKSDAIGDLESTKSNDALSLMQQLSPLVHASPDAGAYFMAGSDLLDGLAGAYSTATTSVQRTLVGFAYLCLSSLCQGERPNYSLLSDHLYCLKASADQSSTSRSFLAELVTNTPLLQIIEDKMKVTDAARATKLETTLTPFKDPSIARTTRVSTLKLGKGKSKLVDGHGHNISGEIHIHRMSLVSQIQDLFPDLGSGFITQLLDEYNDNVETVTAHLLENSLPPHLQSLDRTTQLPPMQPPSGDMAASLIPRSTPPASPAAPSRRTIFDDDALSNLDSSALSRLHLGRRSADASADTLLASRAGAPPKAAILAALAAFDADDDERDDAYDGDDVGGSVDVAEEEAADAGEEALWAAWKADPAVFARDAATRRGAPRRRLRAETGLLDEAIEGWAVMLQRDPRRVRRLEARYGVWTGLQSELGRTAWRADDGGEEDGGEGSHRGGRGRGRGRAAPRRRGNVAGPASDEGTQRARQRKEAHKGSRANHNRRDQRAKKMARGGFPG